MRLETFLFFFDLELGGTIIGFYHLIVYCLLVIASVISFVVAAIYYSDEVNLIYLALAIVVGIILLCILIYISWQLVLGVEFRDHRRVQKFRILCMIGLILNVILVISAFTQIGRFNFNGYHITLLVVYLIISFITQVYIFLVVDSLFKKFRDEEFPRSNMAPPEFRRVS